MICCALPALFIAVGAGAALVGLVTAVPGLVWISAHEVGVFVFAGLVLLVAGVIGARSQRLFCPMDPELRTACNRIRGASRLIFVTSAVLFGLGAIFAFVLPLFG